MNGKEIVDLIISFLKGLMQPLITFVAVIILFALAKNGYDQDKIFAVVGMVILFWFGYTAIKNFNFNGKSKDDSPKVSGGQAVKTTATAVKDTAVSAVEEKRYSIRFGDTWFQIKPGSRETFLEGEFMADVTEGANLRLQGRSGETTIAAMYYTARDKISGLAAPWKFANVSALRGAVACVFDLVEKAFTEIWGVDYETATNPENKCTSCGCGHEACACKNADAKKFIKLEHERVQSILLDMA